MSLVGRYKLLVSENGEYAVEWREGANQYIVRLPGLIRIIDEMVVQDLAARKHFISIFRKAFSGNDESFINSPDGEILKYLDDKEASPKDKLEGEKLVEFNIRKLLLAYNRWKGTSLKYREVISFCK
jgi:hypothetical protein